MIGICKNNNHKDNNSNNRNGLAKENLSYKSTHVVKMMSNDNMDNEDKMSSSPVLRPPPNLMTKKNSNQKGKVTDNNGEKEE